MCKCGLRAVEVGQDHGHWCVQVVFFLLRWARIMGTGVYRWSSSCGGGPGSWAPVCTGGLLPVEVGQDHGHGVCRWSSSCGGGPGSRAPVCTGSLRPVEVGQDHGHRCVQVVLVLWRWARIRQWPIRSLKVTAYCTYVDQVCGVAIFSVVV